MEATPISPDLLDDLVAATDEAGGPSSPAARLRWASWAPVAAPDDLARFEGVDPFSEAYGDLQLELWSRWAGRDYDPSSSELTDFEFAAHLESRTAYGTIVPLDATHHYLSVARAVSALGLGAGRVLEVGAGWGLQAELLSELGFEVDVVDVNPAFVRLIGERLDRRGFGGRRVVGTFDDFPGREGGYELAYTYEALHHSPQPCAAVRRLVDPSGAGARRVAFVGEPVLEMWPGAWGLRTDPESLYCIRKFGWFESGWSAEFILSCVARAGLGVLLLRPLTSARDGIVAGSQVAPLDPGDPASWSPFAAGWLPGPDGLTSSGESALAFSVDDAAGVVVLDLGWHNPRPTTLGLTLLCGDAVERSALTLDTGVTEHEIELPPGTGRVVSILVDGEAWCPQAVLGVADPRRISVEVVGVRTERFRRPAPKPQVPEAAPLPPPPPPALVSLYHRARRRLPSLGSPRPPG